ncbi:hypothetical protein HYE26_03900 [Mycoplasmopsis bovis]|nr:hypothetical protein [Mycoplasmopsis bovis]QQH23146.1 hypothetical protein HYE26_03900 [Mycoplasmopsis bovis]
MVKPKRRKRNLKPDKNQVEIKTLEEKKHLKVQIKQKPGGDKNPETDKKPEGKKTWAKKKHWGK